MNSLFQKVSLILVLSGIVGDLQACTDKPTLSIDNDSINSLVVSGYEEALAVLCDRLTIEWNESDDYNSTGLMVPGKFIVAGGAYPQPWQRDSGFMTYDAGNLLEPTEALNTLYSQLVIENGKLVIKEGLSAGQNDQYWDRICWAFGAWNHYLITGDTIFLSNAYEAISQTLIAQRAQYFNKTYGLFTGGSILDDNIDAYQPPIYDYWRGTAAVAYPRFHTIMASSNNMVWYWGYRIAALMATELGKSQAEINNWNSMAGNLKSAINRVFWVAGSNRYVDYIQSNGTKINVQNDLALSFAILYGVADSSQTAAIIKNVHLEPAGIPHKWPHASYAFSDQRPSREGGVLWGNGQAAWAEAMARAGRVDLFAQELMHIAQNRKNSNGNFREILDSITGEPEGGWESNGSHIEESNLDQGWTATGYLKLIHYGIFGMRFEKDGLLFSPSLPEGWSRAELNGVKYRDMSLNIIVTGSGNQIGSFKLDQRKLSTPKISSLLTGEHTVEIVLSGGAASVPPIAQVTTFSDQPEGDNGLDGIYDGINFGAGNWRVGSESSRESWQRHIWLANNSNGVVSNTLTFTTNRVFLGLRAWTGTSKAATLEISSPGNPTRIFKLATDVGAYRTNWSKAASSVTIKISTEAGASDVNLAALTFENVPQH